MSDDRLRRGLPAVRDDLGLFEGYHSPQLDVEVRLNTNESPEGPPAAWLARLQAALAEVDFNRYPDRAAGELRAAIADLHGVRAEQVFVANGSNEVLQTILLAYGGPGRTAATFEPTYALHSHIARLTGTGVVSGHRDDAFRLDLGEVRELLTRDRPDVTFICSPNNPSGTTEPREAVEAIVSEAPGLVVVDEAYGQFARWSAISLVGDDVPLVVVRTFSKTWSLAALRLGYLVGPAPLVAELEKVALPYHLDSLKQLAGRLALEDRAEMEARVERLVAERGRLAAGLERLEVDVWPSEANFVLFRPRYRDGDEVWKELVARGVLVRNCASWAGLDGCLRVTIGTPSEDDRFLSALTEALAPAASSDAPAPGGSS